LSTAGTSNPYHEARGIWNERYQNLVRARWNWQLIAFGELFVIIVFALALVWHASQSKVVPYVGDRTFKSDCCVR
jgi:type IV secretory pathway TrbF-like protein